MPSDKSYIIERSELFESIYRTQHLDQQYQVYSYLDPLQKLSSDDAYLTSQLQLIHWAIFILANSPGLPWAPKSVQFFRDQVETPILALRLHCTIRYGVLWDLFL